MNDDLTTVLANLAEKFDITATAAHEALMRQAGLYVISNLVVAFIWIAVFIAVYIYGKKKLKEWDNDDIEIFFSIIYFGAWAVLLLLVTADLDMLIAALINPEYWALHTLFKSP